MSASADAAVEIITSFNAQALVSPNHMAWSDVGRLGWQHGHCLKPADVEG